MPGRVVTADGKEEWYVDQMLDECHYRHGYQYLVCRQGWGLEENQWLFGSDLVGAEALDIWLRNED
jgi:hypothetical protein